MKSSRAEQDVQEVALRAANHLRSAIDSLEAAYDVLWDAGAHDTADGVGNTKSAAMGCLTDVERWADGF